MVGQISESVENILDALPGMWILARKRDGRIRFANQRAATHFVLECDKDGGSDAATLFVRPARPIMTRGDDASDSCIAVIVDRDGRQLLIGGRSGSFIEAGEEFVAVGLQESAVREASLQSTQNAYQSETMRRVFALCVHQLGNALIPLFTFADLALAEQAEGAKQKDYLQRIVAGAERCAALVEEMREYCRKGAAAGMGVELTTAVRGAEAMLACALPKRVALDTDYDGEPLMVAVDGGLLQDVIVGLGVAALDAVGSVPSLIMLSTAHTVSATDDPVAEMRIDILDIPSASKVVVNASGGDPDCVVVGAKQPDIAMVQDIVRGLGGSLEAERTAEGLCIRMSLPMKAEATAD